MIFGNHHHGHASDSAVVELKAVQQQTDAARVALARLHQDVSRAEMLLQGNQSSQLLEANTQLVCSALRAQAKAEATEAAMKDMNRPADFDALTQLPNRVLLLDRFSTAITSAKRRNTCMALLFVNLNNFTQISDTLGQAAGDKALNLAAMRFAAATRATDTISRNGSSEFLILLTEVSQRNDAALIAEKILVALGAPTRLGEHVLRLTASMGISIYPDDGDTPQTLIDRADAALHRAKERGVGGFAFYRDEPAGKQTLVLPAPAPRQQPLTLYEVAWAETQRHHAQLREANENLMLAALTAQELQTAAEKAQQQQKEFLAIVAHELRNPLTPIRIATALLNRVHADELPRMQAIIEQQVVHMSRLVGDLLDVSRVHTGKLRLEHQTINIVELVNQAADAFRPAMDVRLQRFDVKVPQANLSVYGDPVRLMQILNNLLGNASKYTPEGGDIGLLVAAVGNTVVITVSDNGIGITAQALPHVFEPFVQDAQATVYNGGGLGIGLTVVRELVEAHGGQVVATSAGGDLGSQFVVTLPLVEA